MNNDYKNTAMLVLKPVVLAVGMLMLGVSSFAKDKEQVSEPDTLETIYVHSRKDEVVTRVDSPNPVLIATRDEIEKTNDLTLGDFLRRQPGISFTGPAGNIKDIRMRGLDKGYTQILVDGEPWLGSTKERQVQVDQLPMSMVERVEIIRSPLPDMNSEGIGGTINIVLRRAEADELNIKLASGNVWYPQGDKPQYSLQLNYARIWDTGLSLVMPINVNDRYEVKVKPKVVDAVDVLAGEVTPNTEALENEVNHVKEFTLGPRLTYRPDGVNAFSANVFYNLNQGAKTKTTDNWIYDSGAYRKTDNAIEWEDKDRSSLMLSAEWQRKLSEVMTATVGISAQQASEDKHKPKTTYDVAGAIQATELEDATVRGQSQKLHGRLNWSASDAHTLAMGLEWRDEGRKDRKVKNGALQAGLGDRFDIDESRYTAFLRDDWTLHPNHSLVSGFRYEARETSSTDANGVSRSGDSGAFNPSVAYKWSFAKGWRLRAAAAQTVRAPKFENLTSAIASGTGSSTTPYISGNPELKPEHATGIDLGVEKDFFGKTALIGFNYTQRRITDAVATQTQQEDDGYYYQRPYNVAGVSRTQAYELDGSFDLRVVGLKNVTAVANYSRFFSRKAGTTDPLGDQPRYVANTGMDWRVQSIHTLFGWRYNYQGKIRKSQNETESEQHLLDAFAYWNINAQWALRVSGSNLLNTKKTKYKPGYDGTGRLNSVTREQETGGRGLLFTLEARL